MAVLLQATGLPFLFRRMTGEGIDTWPHHLRIYRKGPLSDTSATLHRGHGIMRHRRPALVPLPSPREDDASFLAFAWFREEEYAIFKALLPERDWHDTFTEWEKDIERHVWLAKVNGVGTVRVTVGVADFVEWCVANGLPVESSSLSKFASAHGALPD